MQDIVKANETSRQLLSQGITFAQNFIREIPEKHRKGVEKIWPEVEDTFVQHLQELNVANPVILIAGMFHYSSDVNDLTNIAL